MKELQLSAILYEGMMKVAAVVDSDKSTDLHISMSSILENKPLILTL